VESQIKNERRAQGTRGSENVPLSVCSAPHTGRTEQRRSRSHSLRAKKSTKLVTRLGASGPAVRLGTTILFADTPRVPENELCPA